MEKRVGVKTRRREGLGFREFPCAYLFMLHGEITDPRAFYEDCV